MKIRIFKFEKYNFNPKTGIVVFEYELSAARHENNLKFKERLIFPMKGVDFQEVNKEAFDKALFNLFFIAGISYYKIYCPKKIDLGKYKLTGEQAKFWNKVYTKGLGEFFYKNKIDYRGLVKFPYDKNYQASTTEIKIGKKYLVPLGGGKDSIVALEMLREQKKDFDLMSVRDLKIVRDAAKVAHKKLLIIERQIDSKLLKLNNKKGVYNGHIPFNAYLAFISLAAAILYDYQFIVLANESSANRGNVKYLGQIINHQYSKSAEFEKDFQKYIAEFITPSIKYYSILRSLNELKITKKFVQYKKYFPVFSSCNDNFKLGKQAKKRWCGECSKCVFVWTMLSAYLPKKELIKIFCQNLYAKKELKDTFLLLLGRKGFKPFECVGTPWEMKMAMRLAQEEGEYNGDIIMKEFKKI